MRTIPRPHPIAVAMLALFAREAPAAGALRMTPRGVTFASGALSIDLDRNERLATPILRFLPDKIEIPLSNPHVERDGEAWLRLTYVLETPAGGLEVERVLQIEEGPAECSSLHETFSIAFDAPIATDLEIERPFQIVLPPSPGTAAVLPLQNGWARTVALSPDGTSAEYRLGNPITAKETPALALPLVEIVSPPARCALMADPTFAALFSLDPARAVVGGSLRYRYAASCVPLRGTETRAFGVRLGRGADPKAGFDAALDAFFTLMLPDVPPGPRWLHDIAMVDYDFLSDDGKGWDRDVRLLGEWLAPGERSRVALCLHGWYDALGAYAYDAEARKIKDEWVAFARTRKVAFTQDEIRRRIRAARSQGFRALLYFADGLAADSGVPGYRDDWAYRDAEGRRISGWQGPDTFGKTFLRNPAHPEVFQWYIGYMDALLAAFGPDVDGFVWDETFHARIGQIAATPEPAYCDRAMMALVKALAARVETFDPEKVFLASDCVGVFGWSDVPGYAMVADGTYQDTHASPVAWSYGLFPNWRNTLWSCNWGAMSSFHFTRWGVETFGVPVAISNGWGDDRGPSEWTTEECRTILDLFRKRCAAGPRVRYLAEDPEILLGSAPNRPSPGDPLPAPAAGEVNWAASARGSRAIASSEERIGAAVWPASGLIDGVRDDAGWGSGHGWASARGEPLPQWAEVDFGVERTISRFVVITYEKEKTEETASKWGVIDYAIEIPESGIGAWKSVVDERRGRAVKVRAHELEKPVRTSRFRIIVRRVAPLDGQARLLQLEAWGPGR
ncbi:MAG: discoidin domain-containing protein [Planctomycetes bacterium]|nr:discoidin domain-containing protein [Planctomycetota bacterium]